MTRYTQSRTAQRLRSAALATGMGMAIGLCFVWWWSCGSAC